MVDALESVVPVFLTLFEGEVVADVFVKEGAFCDASAWDCAGNPEVAGGAAIEVEGVSDFEAGDGLRF